MRALSATLLGLCIFLPPARAADLEKVRPNTLTPQEIAEGWILLFDGETTFGWGVAGDAKVKDGQLILGGSKTTAIATTARFSYYTLRFEFQPPVGHSRVVLDQQRWEFRNFIGGELKIRELRDADGWVQSQWEILPDDGGVGPCHQLRGRYGKGTAVQPFSVSNLTGNRGPIGMLVSPGETLAIRSVKLKPYEAKLKGP
jgi:hypothetical protein